MSGKIKSRPENEGNILNRLSAGLSEQEVPSSLTGSSMAVRLETRS